LRGSTGKRPKNYDRNRKKKKRCLVMNYLGSSQQNYYMDRGGKNTKKKGKKDGTKIGDDRKIPQDEET